MCTVAVGAAPDDDVVRQSCVDRADELNLSGLRRCRCMMTPTSTADGAVRLRVDVFTRERVYLLLARM